MTDIPENYLLFNSYSNKEIQLVIQIAGLNFLLSSNTLFTTIRYGDPIVYGEPGLVYGGLRRVTDAAGNDSFKNILSLDGSSLTLSQRLEPEQGRGATSTLALAFIDKDGFMTRLISPGILIPDLLGADVKVWLGYKQISFPEDYFVIFRGVVSQIASLPGLITLQLSDSNIKRRQKLFYTAKTKLTAPIDAVVTTLPLISTGDFYTRVLGPDGLYDDAVKLYINIEDEWMEYTTATVNSNSVVGVTRGSRGTTAASHDADSDVTVGIQLEDHALTIALKLMLSGWGGYFITGVTVKNLVRTGDTDLGDQYDAIILPDGVNALEDYGLSIGDYVTVENAADPLNNKVLARIIDLGELFGRPNQIIYLDSDFNSVEIDSPATLSFRSRYDTYPSNAGLRMRPSDVDVDGHTELQNTFLIEEQNRLRFFITQQENQGKTFIEKECYLPVSCYSVTRFGRLSVKITKPPIADQRLSIIDKTNILDMNNVAPTRGLNNRAFFNEIQFYWDATDAGEFTSVIKFLDSDSLSIIGVSSVLPIETKGSRTDLGSNTLFEKRSQFLLSRYKQGAEQIQLTVNWGTGNQIEAGDVVALSDNGELFISNISTGTRDLGVKLYEVIERTIDIRSGNVKLKLQSGVGGEFTDRFGTVSPSSIITTGSTTTSLKIIDSYGALYPGNESRKWREYLGEEIMVHSPDYSDVRICDLIGIDPGDRYRLQVANLTGGAPPSGYIIDIPDYPTSDNKLDAAIYKNIHAFQDPQVVVVTGTALDTFEVSSADIDKFFVDTTVDVHSEDYSVQFDEKTVIAVNVTANTVQVDSNFDFVPTGNMLVDLIGFSFDRGGAYRLIAIYLICFMTCL